MSVSVQSKCMTIDNNVIYSRIIGLQASGREVDIDDVLKYELAPIPMAMFDSSGDESG